MSFSLVMPRLDLAPDEQYELCPGHTLRRATSDEIDQIRNTVGDSQCFGGPLRSYFECKPVKKEDQTLLMVQPRHLWNYCIVHFDGDDEDLAKLEYALDFIYFAPVLAISLFESGGLAWNSRYLGHGLMQRLLHWASTAHEFKFPANVLPTVRAIYSSLKPLAQDDSLLRPFRRFHLLKHLPVDSDAHVLGLFSVIEMILTHKPSENLHDSLRHQVSTKMELLSKRFMKNELYDLFPKVGRAELWKALYDWRSLIAHGEDVDFKKGTLQKLETSEKARVFLDLSVRLLLKTWIDERELVLDLKRC
jgi:hypothetical protein